MQFRCSLLPKPTLRGRPHSSRAVGLLIYTQGLRGPCIPQKFAGHASRTVTHSSRPSAAQLNDKKPISAERSMKDLLSLKGKVTVVTGGGRGIGLALARGAAEMGSDVAVLDMLEQPDADFLRIESDFGVRARYYRTNVTNMESLTNSFDQTVEAFGQINNCITAAGIAWNQPFLDTTWDEISRVMNVNVLGTYFSAQLAARHMRAAHTGGSIVLIASIAGHAALSQQRLSVYGTSKAAVKALGQHLAVELGPIGIRVNSISPGYIATEMIGSLAATDPELMSVFSSTPLQRVGERQDLKGLVTYLLSDAAAYTTGSDIFVSGGVHAGRI